MQPQIPATPDFQQGMQPASPYIPPQNFDASMMGQAQFQPQFQPQFQQQFQQPATPMMQGQDINTLLQQFGVPMTAPQANMQPRIDPIELLLNQAKNYNNPTDFINSQGLEMLHGTNQKFTNFDISKRGMNENDFPSKNAFFFTDSLDTAKSYGKNLVKSYGKFDKPLTIDAEGSTYGDFRDDMRDAIEKAKKEGNDIVIIKNLSDRKDWGNYEPATHYAVLNIDKLKSEEQLKDIWNKANPQQPETSEQNDIKQKQLDIVKKLNPMTDEYHTGIRSVDDIKTYQEAFKNPESFAYPDFSKEQAQKALQSGKITIYSSKPLDKNEAQFVTPSKMNASDYAGNGKVYSKEVNLDEVAWINGDEGQLTGQLSDKQK